MRRRTVDLLPEIFRTETNQQFLAATLDQLTQEPSLLRTQGYVGRRVGPGVNPADNYVVEPTETRANYQLEPGVVFFKPNTTQPEDAITYPGMIDALAFQGGIVDRQDRLFSSEFYSWDPFCDLDKFVNYNQYYWLPAGPDAVDVGSTDIPLTDEFVIDRTAQGYRVSGFAEVEPVLTLVRGGSYKFTVNQPGNGFWIQSFPGVNGRLPATPNISSRDVLGVINNGEDQGTVTFNVPLKSAQNFFYGLADIGGVDLLTTTLKFNQINNVYVDTFLSRYPTGIDGITNLDDRTIVFTNPIQDPQDGGWQINSGFDTTDFDPLFVDGPETIVPGTAGPPRNGPANYTDRSTVTDGSNGQPGSYDQTTDITLASQKYSVWRINYVTDGLNRPFMQLTSIQEVNNLTKFQIRFGDQWANTQWYKDASGAFQKVPLLTAILDELWYQDSTDPEFFGRIRLIDPQQVQPLDINEIIGARDYVSPNGVVFTNGLKIQFRGPSNPPEFQDLEYYIEGVGTGPGIDARVGFVDGEAYFGEWHQFGELKLTGAVHSEEEFQQIIYETVDLSLANVGSGYPADAPAPGRPLPLELQSNGIKLLPVNSFVTPETYTRSATVPYDSTPFDVGNYDSTLNAPLVPDYLTVNRASRDLNAWTRSNRWFHEDVIRYSAELNNQEPTFDNQFRGKRPIIEFRNNLELYNFGTQGKRPVNIIDFSATDAFSDINGQIGYSIDGYSFLDGTRVIFAADRDGSVRNKIYRVEFIDPDGSDFSPPIINLVPADDAEILPDQTVVSLSGNTQQGVSYWFDGAEWQRAQQKTNVNQAPLFDIRDANGRSLGDIETYPSSTFRGTRLFGYAEGGTQIVDNILGLSLKYLNIRNVGDILFENYFYTDKFLYVRDSVSQTEPISQGFVRQYQDRLSFSNLIGWQVAAQENRSRQVFRFIYDGSPLILDVPVDESSVFAPLQIYQGVNFIDPTQYRYELNSDGGTTIVLTNGVELGTVIEVQAISSVKSSVGYYQVPSNLENNPLNENSNAFTLGTIRTHYQSIGQNLRDLRGPIDGANNTRDLGDILRYGDNIIQNSSPAALAGVFLRQEQYEVISAIEFNSREYQKYKTILLDLTSRGDFVNKSTTAILDDVITEIALSRNPMGPFYWSDMLPSGENYQETLYTYTTISTPTFDTVQIYDFSSSNFLGLSVYLNGRLLQRGYDYEVGDDAPTVTVTVPLSVGDQIAIREYPSTVGSYVPNTPSKMGLYPAYRPEIFLDESYLEPTMMIRGHDGSLTVAFNDDRDQVLLEFETRIFNNIKIVSRIPITAEEVIPGQFRDTGYSLNEINSVLAPDFLSWVGWNKLDYAEQTYLAADAFTYNYGQSENKLNRQPLLGAWRGIYQYFYDTVAPNTRPWEMLGFSQQPEWWQAVYGPAPYTSGNLVLWDDLAEGIVRDPDGIYVLPEYRRPDLSSVIPSGSEGELVAPLDVTVGNFDSNSFRRSWTFGDGGPVEYAWRSSSAWPFAVMRLLSLTKPAKFFSLLADRDRYVYDEVLGQYLWDSRYRLDAKRLTPLYGNGVSKASYVNWIIDYNRQLGNNSTQSLTTTLDNIGVRLCWRMAAYSDKRFLKIFTERSTPTSTNTGLLLPDESYRLLLYKNQPFEQVTYSSVIVQKVDSGWQVLGYSTTRPYFEILQSRINGSSVIFEAGGASARVAVEHTDRVVQVPYGYVFRNTAAVCDFLYSYGKLLTSRGFVFETQENGYIMDWNQMIQEFLYWSNQGWTVDSMINLNPAAGRLSLTRPQSVADDLTIPRPENLILNQNRQALPSRDLVIERLNNTIRITSLTANTINYFTAKFTAYEHLMILDNVSIFADLIYDPVTGARQSRVQVAGTLSGDWNGTLNAPGFILNQDNIPEWRANVRYTKGEIVLFKNEYWSATTIIEPSQEFDYSKWLRSDYDEIQTGLLPNAANSSDQLALAYSVNDVNLEQEVDLFSYGLIGFRPRDYMQALNLDDVSQVGVYQQFLGSKGTRRSAELFTLADLGKETARYEIYEYWAMLKDSYGATANRNYVEIVLDAARLKSNPGLVQVIEPFEQSLADQTVLLTDLWKTSDPVRSTNIFPSRTVPITDSVFPSAGYVNFEDVDFTIFDLAAATAQDISGDNIGTNTTIWAAKVNSHDWGVFRVGPGPGNVIQVSDNLDGRSLVTFNQQHGLSVNDWLIIRFFSDTIDGAYRVRAVPSLDTVLIDFVFTGTQTTVAGKGVGFTLESARVKQPSDIAQLSYANNIVPGARVWVDNDGTGNWVVVEKTRPFGQGISFRPQVITDGSRFGASVAQGLRNLSAMVGAPGQGASGAVHTFVRDFENQYVPNLILDLEGTTGSAGFGTSMDSGDQTWAVVGAPQSLSSQGYAVVIFNPPTSNAFVKWQLLVDGRGDSIAGAGDEFGYSVTVSKDERWIYVGAPGINRVYAYGRVDAQEQTVSYTADGSTGTFSYANEIVIDTADQIAVVLNNETLTLGVNYLVSLGAGTITLFTTPTPGSRVVITRRSGATIPVTTPTTTLDLSNIYTARDIESFSIYVNDAIQRPMLDYEFDEITRIVTFLSGPIDNSTVQIRSGTHYRLVETIDATLDVPGFADPFARFGHSVSTTSDGRTLIVGAPGSSGELQEQGLVYVFDRSAQRFQVQDNTQYFYSTVENFDYPGAPITVTRNGVFLINDEGNIGGQYRVILSDDSAPSNTVEILTDIDVGDIIEVETNQFQLVQTIEDQRPYQAAEYGYVVDQCINDCSLYVGAPSDGSIKPGAGHVEFLQNQSRVYGTTISVQVNPALTPYDTVRVDDYSVAVPDPAFWVQAAPWPAGSLVTDGTSLYVARESVPANTPITELRYWSVVSWITALANSINAANDGIGVPNVRASATPDLVLRGNGVDRTFQVGARYQLDETLVYVNNVLSSSYDFDQAKGTITFDTTPPDLSEIRLISARLVISIVNFESSIPLDRVRILPGTGTVFDDLVFETYAHTQTITAPDTQSFARFGHSVFVSDSTLNLVIGAPNGTAIEVTSFDLGRTTFDADSLEFRDPVAQSGAVYTYDLLPAADATINNPGQFVFGQQIYDSELDPSDQFGTAVDYTTGVLLVGVPGDDGTVPGSDRGRVAEFNNVGQIPAWTVRRRQQPVVDSSLLNTIFLYDRFQGGGKRYLDYIDPLQGRILGAARQNIDYITGVDPAAYNTGELNNYGDRWAQEKVGDIWWDIANTRFIDPNQDDIVYASRRWSQLFPGSTVDVYQWIASTVPPAQYTGPGVPRYTDSYTITSEINEQGIFDTIYYFWVSGVRAVDRPAGKTLSIDTIARYIENPRSSGIAYLAPINSSTVALYNVLPSITAQDTVIHIEFDETENQDAIHVEYRLIPENRADGFLDERLYRKMLDSFCGIDTEGNAVPDPKLPISEQTGTGFCPRQTMFVNRFLALENYLTTANQIMARYPLAETRIFPLLASSAPEPAPSSGAWDQRVANLEELSFQNLIFVPVGYRYLVATDSSNNGLWTIYQVTTDVLLGNKQLTLIQVQDYDTRLYWNFQDWYRPGYDPLTRIVAEVPTVSALDTITVPDGSSVRVTQNFQGRAETYILEAGQWNRVGLQNGTMQISSRIWDYAQGRYGFDVEVFDSQYFDQEPVIETRKILQSLNQEIFVGDLALERNRLLVLMFNYILSEQQDPLWLTKTSLVDVNHVIRNLEPFQIYRRDNQDFVLEYIQEVKPYHTQIKSFNLIYQGNDNYPGDVTDFDVPAYWNSEQQRFVSPVLSDVVPPINPCGGGGSSVVPSTNPLWQTWPYDQWFNNYLLGIQSVDIIDGGQGYTVPPVVVVSGECVEPAVMIARINSAGQVNEIEVINPGRGYLTTAIITLEGGNGAGAQAVARMGNELVRSIKTTIKYDRYEYSSSVKTWQPGVIYQVDDLVRYADLVWQATVINQAQAFEPDDWVIVPAGELSGVDRTMGYYVPAVNQPGLDLALLISGVDYPGVQVQAPGFSQNTGYDVGNYDINPFDNISFGTDGRPTYDPAILDAIYESDFTDPYLGILPNGVGTDSRPGAILVDGGEFIDTYSSHAPEELVPGAIFDTLDMRVFTTPGSDWSGDGHGFPLNYTSYVFSPGIDFNFSALVDYVASIKVFNQTTRQMLTPVVDYVIDWATLSVRVVNNATSGDTITVMAYGVGGGNQIYTDSYRNNEIVNIFVLPVAFSRVNQVVIFADGVVLSPDLYTVSAMGAQQTLVDIATVITFRYMTVVVLGEDSQDASWSTPITQYVVADGVNFSWEIDASLQGTNPSNIVVTRNGFRARPAEGIQYRVIDPMIMTYALPDRGAFDLALVSDNEVDVYVNNQPLISGVGFNLDPDDGSSVRTVTLTVPLAENDNILISVDTAADYYLANDTLLWRPNSGNRPIAGDILSFTTFNDTLEQDLLTKVFVGPSTQGAQLREPYDSQDYSYGDVNSEPGSYDFGAGILVQTNRFDLGREFNRYGRLMVTVNGRILFSGRDFQVSEDLDFTVEGQELVILGPILSPNDVLVVTMCTDSVVPGEIGFRIFQDMRGRQSSYKISRNTTTRLAQPLLATDSVIYVDDVSALSVPNLEAGIFGIVTVNSERITYRVLDPENNSLTGLRRGTAGTGAEDHAAGTAVYSMNIGELLPPEYQDRTVVTKVIADGTDTIFTADNIDLSAVPGGLAERAVEIYAGGSLVTAGYTISSLSPVTIEFDQAPSAGVEVSVQVKQGQWWYDIANDAERSQSLQENSSRAARFIRGN